MTKELKQGEIFFLLNKTLLSGMTTFHFNLLKCNFQIEMCFKYEIHAEFETLHVRKECKIIHE